MEFVTYLTFFIAGILFTALAAYLVGRRLISAATSAMSATGMAERSTLTVQLEAAQKRTSELSGELSDREGRIEQLQEECRNEIGRRSAAEEQVKQIPDLHREIGDSRAKLESASVRLLALEKEKAELVTTVDKDRESLSEKLELLDQAKRQLSDMFAALSSEALKSNNQQFLDLAKQSFEGLQSGARVDLEQRQKTILELVAPVKQSLEKVDLRIQELEIARAGAYEGNYILD